MELHLSRLLPLLILFCAGVMPSKAQTYTVPPSTTNYIFESAGDNFVSVAPNHTPPVHLGGFTDISVNFATAQFDNTVSLSQNIAVGPNAATLGAGAGNPTVTLNGDLSGSSTVVLGYTNVPATFILVQNTSFSGTTIVANQTTLQFGDGNGSGTAGTIGGTITNNGAIVVNVGDGGFGYTIANAISGSGTLEITGTSNVVMTGAALYTGLTTVDENGFLNVGGGGGTSQLTGDAVANGTLAFQNNGTFTYGGNISGTGQLEVQANTFIVTGNITVSSVNEGFGTIQIGNGGTTGSVSSDIEGFFATLAFDRSGTYVFTGTSQVFSLNQIGSGTTILNDDNQVRDQVTISSGTLQIGNGGTTGSLSGNASVDDEGTLAFSRSDDVTFSNPISGAGNLVQGGSGTLQILGANSYSGGTFITAGGLQLGDGNTTGASLGTGDVSVGGGTIFTLDLANGETFANNIVNHGSVVLDDTPFHDYTVSGLISGGGTVTKSGTNTVTLSHANAYSGGTTISGGALIVADPDALGTGNVVNNASLTTGSSVHGMVINVGGDFTQGATGVLGLAIYGPGDFDSVHLTNPNGVAHLNGELLIVLPGNFTPGAGQFNMLTSSNLIDGQFSSVVTTLPAIGATVNYTNNVTVLFQRPFTGLGALTPNQFVVAGYLDAHDQQISSSGFANLIGALNGMSVNPMGSYFNQLTTVNFAQFTSSTAFNNTSFLLQGHDDYMANHRGRDGSFVASVGGIDYSGLTINDPDYLPGLQQVHTRLLAWSPPPSAGLLSDTSSWALGGVDMKEMKHASVAPEGNQWNAFVSGNAILAQNFSDAASGQSHEDATTGGVQVGADYQLTPNFIIGAMFGFGHTEADLDNIGSKATVDTYSPAVYASFAKEGWYANALASYGFSDYSQDRSVDIGTFDGQGHSSPSGNQVVGNLDGGYDFHLGHLTYGPTLGVQYVHLDVDSYSETGLPGADLNVNDNQADSLRSRLGGRVSYAFQDRNLTFVPHFSASWQHEFLDQSRGITSQFSDVSAGSFEVQTANPSRDSALLDLGLDTQLDQAVTVFVDYTVQAGQENYFGQSIQAGVKVGF